MYVFSTYKMTVLRIRSKFTFESAGAKSSPRTFLCIGGQNYGIGADYDATLVV